MSKFADLVKELKEKIFGKEEPKIDSLQSLSLQSDKSPPAASKRVARLAPSRSHPYFVQIGFDFGTAFSKCICRDVMTNKAWVHIPANPADRELPFLIPSTLRIDNGRLQHLGKTGVYYPGNGLYHLKQALEKVAMRQWDAPDLAPYRRVIGYSDAADLARLVEAGAVYYLAGALGEVRLQVRQRLPGFGDLPDDYMAVNLAVPVADAERPAVNALYQQILCRAWVLADHLAGYPVISVDEMVSLMADSQCCKNQSVSDACYIYPEVSANVQGFVRSRASSEGIYLFSDAGAGTVDQSVFIFTRTEHKEQLAYLHGNILPIGSSCIERYAAETSGETDWKQLEYWRELKERGTNNLALEEARDKLDQELNRGTTATLALAKRKLFCPQQLREIRVIFGGGGHCERPYKSGVMASFAGNIFSPSLHPDEVGLPTPVDLELTASEKRWLRRLSVAYGLSFVREELARFIFPVDIQPPKPDELWRPQFLPPDAPTNDDC